MISKLVNLDPWRGLWAGVAVLLSCGVSRAKLAYLADATGSAVACLAFVSTWIAFQLSMIREGFGLAGAEVSAYALFFRSLPTNFYCLFALVLVVVSIRREFNPGPMGSFERSARGQGSAAPPDSPEDQWSPSHWLMAIIPIAVLALSIPLFTYLIGAESAWPFSLKKFAEAYAAALGYGISPWLCLPAGAVFLYILPGLGTVGSRDAQVERHSFG